MEMQKDSVSYGDVEGLGELDSLGICCAAFIPFTADHIKRVHMVIYLSRGVLWPGHCSFRSKPGPTNGRMRCRIPLASIRSTLDGVRSLESRIFLFAGRLPL